MSAIERSKPITNALIAGLPARDRGHFLAACDRVTLSFGDVLSQSGARIDYCYFPTEGYVALIKMVGKSSTLAVGLVGREGFCGVSLVLGVDVALVEVLIQGEGTALRIDAADLVKECARSPVLRRSLNRYVGVHIARLAQSVACQRHHVLEARLARWLLMTADRSTTSKQFRATHTNLAYMLGVGRSIVSAAAESFQSFGLIAYTRGQITILDRAGLQKASCECYRVDIAAYRAGGFGKGQRARKKRARNDADTEKCKSGYNTLRGEF
jgi:CRP-like cAMP-binding protein